ncbi:hypothetical protein K7432_015736 [Basidiobolus ranarum]|uniref:CUE domain-containing protein n=1 Tax=Basidiobolus ranarum TaxID=34480 RepID=A0ABR2WFS9_9FUNG
MNDGVSILVAIFIILLVFRWLLGGSPSNQDGQRRTGTGLSTGRRYVSPEMISTVHSMFPNVPLAAIQADLARTGSVEITCDNILRDGGLPLPVEATPQPSPNVQPNSNTGTSSSTNKATAANLIHRFNINPENEESSSVAPPKVWEATADRRQDNLQRRKEHMILQARKRFLEQQQKKTTESEVTEKTEPKLE